MGGGVGGGGGEIKELDTEDRHSLLEQRVK